jgi:hypothetical protein
VDWCHQRKGAGGGDKEGEGGGSGGRGVEARGRGGEDRWAGEAELGWAGVWCLLLGSALRLGGSALRRGARAAGGLGCRGCCGRRGRGRRGDRRRGSLGRRGSGCCSRGGRGRCRRTRRGGLCCVRGWIGRGSGAATTGRRRIRALGGSRSREPQNREQDQEEKCSTIRCASALGPPWPISHDAALVQPTVNQPRTASQPLNPDLSG